MQRIVVGIEGMMCVKCSGHVVDAVKKISGVKNVEASHEAKQAIIRAKDNVDTDAIRNAITELGYSVTSFSSETEENHGLFSIFKKR